MATEKNIITGANQEELGLTSLSLLQAKDVNTTATETLQSQPIPGPAEDLQTAPIEEYENMFMVEHSSLPPTNPDEEGRLPLDKVAQITHIFKI